MLRPCANSSSWSNHWQLIKHKENRWLVPFTLLVCRLKGRGHWQLMKHKEIRFPLPCPSAVWREGDTPGLERHGGDGQDQGSGAGLGRTRVPTARLPLPETRVLPTRTSEYPVKVQTSQRLGPLFQIELLKLAALSQQGQGSRVQISRRFGVIRSEMLG